MKRVLPLILAVALMLSLTACGGDKKAFEVSKAAYDNVDIAYEITDNFGSDIYEAWRLGIYDDEEILDEGTAYLAGELSLSEDELKDGVVYVLLEIIGSSWEDATDEEKTELRSSADSCFALFEDVLFFLCIGRNGGISSNWKSSGSPKCFGRSENSNERIERRIL